MEDIDIVKEYSVFFCVLPWRTGGQWGDITQVSAIRVRRVSAVTRQDNNRNVGLRPSGKHDQQFNFLRVQE